MRWTETSDGDRPGLRELALPPGFDSSDNILESFYIPALERAWAYDRSVGYFRSSALAVAARGLSHFINGGGRMRLLVGAEVTPEDRDALIGKAFLDGDFADRLIRRLVTPDEVAQRRLQVLAWLAREGRLEVRIAIAVDGHGHPLVSDPHAPYFHEKIGVLRDHNGDGVAFQGSVNESETAWTTNFESFSVYTSWDASAAHFSFWANKFEHHWSGTVSGFRVYPLPEAVRDGLVALAPADCPAPRDPEEPPPLGDEAAVARFLAVAPHLLGADGLAEATTGVTLSPHQRQVVVRLADQYPRSWVVADEVGLGKTISAGMALRQLLLSGEVGRVLILAPANVCRQWQDELFEKFGLWVPRLDGSKVHGAYPEDVRAVSPGSNPYADYPVLIASSHLARRPEQQRLVLEAGPYDLVVVDEAHHARRQHQNDQRYRPSRLLQLLDTVRHDRIAKTLWLLTATPMQVSPVELVDLVRLVGLGPPLSNPDVFMRYYRELAKDDATTIDWQWLDQVLGSTPLMKLGPAERAVQAGIAARLGPIQTARIVRFGTGAEPTDQLVSELGPEGYEALREWLRIIGPVGQYVTRHSRETLRRYRREGILQARLAERDVQPVLIPFTDPERLLYEQLDALLDRLMAVHGHRRGAGFVLTVYRRRLTSSWAAIRRTLLRRLAKERLELDDDLAEEAETMDGEDTAVGQHIDQVQAVPLNTIDLDQIRQYVDDMAVVSDSKLDRLQHDLDAARSAGHSTIVFTQFTDTLEYLRDTLAHVYRSQLATFTGDGGQVFREAEGWVPISKRDLVEAIRARQVTVLLATDAASEGLNLQSASYLINYDMPWNPMRVEQRIGRIDRLGQARETVHIRHYFIPGTVEEAVYNALSRRIDDFRALLGNLQPILGATERAFRGVFRAPRSERLQAQTHAIQDLLDEIDELETSGVDITTEDRLPIPQPGPTPVTLTQLRSLIRDRFHACLDEPGRPVSWDPNRVSRDADAWVALATYGHPRLKTVLSMHGANREPGDGAVVWKGDSPAVAVRADRSPPTVLSNVDEIDELGPAIARGEAEGLARHLVERAEVERRVRYAEVDQAWYAQWEEGIRTRFTDLIHMVISSGCATARYQGIATDPMSIWLSLAHEHTNGLAYAEAFRGRLGVPVGDLLLTELTDRRDPISPAQWASEQIRFGQQLMRLMEEFRQHMSA